MFFGSVCSVKNHKIEIQFPKNKIVYICLQNIYHSQNGHFIEYFFSKNATISPGWSNLKLRRLRHKNIASKWRLDSGEE